MLLFHSHTATAAELTTWRDGQTLVFVSTRQKPARNYVNRLSRPNATGKLLTVVQQNAIDGQYSRYFKYLNSGEFNF